MTAGRFAEGVRILCEQFHGSVTSWGRTPAHNKDVGGVEGGPHTWWLAADVVWDAPVDFEALQERASVLSLRIIREVDHDHVQPADWQNRVRSA